MQDQKQKIMKMNDNGICTCPCHNPAQRIMHMFPCCVKCPNCGLNITYEALEAHKSVCVPQRVHNESPEIIVTLWKDSYHVKVMQS